jgi:hypothetical protein
VPQPLNELETALHAAIERRATMEEFLACLIASKIIVPTETEVQADGSGFSPLIQWRETVPQILAFTDPSHIGPSLHAKAPYQLNVDASWLIRHMALDMGLLLFADRDHGLRLTPRQLAALRARL